MVAVIMGIKHTDNGLIGHRLDHSDGHLANLH